MSLVDPAVTVTISGNDVSSDVRSLTTEQDICSVAQTCTILLDATSGTHAYDPWDTLVVAINGTNRLTGYVVDAVKGRQGYTVQGIDEMKLALDWFITDEVRVDADYDAGWWINYWLELVGITTSGSVETGRNVPPTPEDGEGWIYITVAEIIKQCLSYAGGGYIVVIDGDGVAQIKEKTIGSSSHTLSPIEFSRSQDDSWLRDRAVVFGTTSGSWVDGTWVPGDVTVVGEKPDTPPDLPNTVVISSDFITSQGAADDLAQDLLDFFDENLDIKRCLVAGDESIWLADSATVSDSWSGYSGTGLVTSIDTAVDDRGFRQHVSLDEKCGFVWGFGKPYGQIMFAVEGTLSVSDDVCPWFICDVPDGMTFLSTQAAIKTPSSGSITYELETSTSGSSWTNIHTNIIAPNLYISAENTTFTDAFLPENTLVRFNIAQSGGEDLTVAVRIKLGEV